MREELKNLYAYRVLTLGEIKVLGEREANKLLQLKNKGSDNVPYNIIYQDNTDDNKVMVIREVLEDVKYKRFSIFPYSQEDKMMTLDVSIQEGGKEYTETLEYLLTPQEEPNKYVGEYRIYVIEEDNN